MLQRNTILDAIVSSAQKERPVFVLILLVSALVLLLIRRDPRHLSV